MQIFGIAGKMECGKTTLANHMAKILPNIRIVNFGDILKEEVSKTYNFPLDWCYSAAGKAAQVCVTNSIPEPPHSMMTVRELLQWYGTDYMRTKDMNYWPDQMSCKLASLVNSGVRNIIIADVRFPNEVEYVNRFKGKVIRLRPYPEWDKFDSHESETALDDMRTEFWLDIAPPFGSLKITAAYIAALLEDK